MTGNSLNIALSGLRTAQAQVNLLSANISNATTEGYTRKTLSQSNVVIAGATSGVRTNEVQRSVDQALQLDLFTQTSLASNTKAQLKYLDQIQIFHGDPALESSLPSLLQSLNNDFLALSDEPNSAQVLNQTVNTARDFAARINDTSAMYTSLRNEAQTEMQDSVNTINQLLNDFVEVNNDIVTRVNTGQSTAALDDQRDLVLLKLSEQLDISYFTTTEGRTIVQTKEGDLLADSQARLVVFNPTPLNEQSAYPSTANGVFIRNPSVNNASLDIEITTRDLGGRLGGLLDMRDTLVPRYQAELDEIAQKVSQRFSEQGLQLFNDNSGVVPAHVDAPTSTSYVGYSRIMQVNDSVINNPNLLRLGTEGETISTGSTTIIDRINRFTFGDVRGELALGNVDLDATGVADLFTTLSLDESAKFIGEANIQALPTLDAADGIIPGTNDTFTIQLGIGTPVDIVIGAGDTATDLVNTINASFAGLASLSATGRLVLESNEDIILTDNNIGLAGLEDLGITPSTTPAQDPSFTIQINDGAVTTIPITSTDTSTELLSKLNAVAGVSATLDADGYLNINTTYGADINLVDGLSKPLAAMGVKINQIAHTDFRTTNLGTNGDISGEVRGSTSLISYGQRLIASQSGETSDIRRSFNTEETFRQTIEEQLSNESGVNIDNEIANLVAYQRVYSANAQVISVSIELLDELFAAI